MVGDLKLLNSCWVKFRCFLERQNFKGYGPFLLTLSKIEFDRKIGCHVINVTL